MGIRTAEHNQKVSAFVKQSWTNPEIREKRIASMQNAGQGDPQSIVTPHGTYDSITEAAECMRVTRQTIYVRLKKYPSTYFYKNRP